MLRGEQTPGAAAAALGAPRTLGRGGSGERRRGGSGARLGLPRERPERGGCWRQLGPREGASAAVRSSRGNLACGN